MTRQARELAPSNFRLPTPSRIDLTFLSDLIEAQSGCTKL